MIVVGLGNPGTTYGGTRHNVGFMVVEEMARRARAARTERRRNLWVDRATGTPAMVLARPRTFMNRSGVAVRELLERERAGPADLLIICDDLYLPFESMRLRRRGSHGGHNGLRSVIACLGTSDFARLRIGIGPAAPGVEHADFVLEAFSRAERERLADVVATAADCAAMAVAEGIGRAMERYNRRPAGREESR